MKRISASLVRTSMNCTTILTDAIASVTNPVCSSPSARATKAEVRMESARFTQRPMKMTPESRSTRLA